MISTTERIKTSNLAKPLDRRRNPRYTFTAEVEVSDPTSGISVRARTADLSWGGCYIDTLSPLAPETVVKVRLTKWERSLEAQAKVVYSATGMGMGLMFVSIDPTQRWTMESWITELGREQRRES